MKVKFDSADHVIDEAEVVRVQGHETVGEDLDRGTATGTVQDLETGEVGQEAAAEAVEVEAEIGTVIPARVNGPMHWRTASLLDYPR